MARNRPLPTRRECRLFNIPMVVVNIAVKYQPTILVKGEVTMRPHFGDIERVILAVPGTVRVIIQLHYFNQLA